MKKAASQNSPRTHAGCLAVGIIVVAICTPLFALNDGTVRTPPMGWNNWYYYWCDNLNEKAVIDNAVAMITRKNSAGKTMKDVGYSYINLDDCWQVSRDGNGFIVEDRLKFPKGIKQLSDTVHSMGLKFGLYTCAGDKTCANMPGSKGFEVKDAQQYASWKVDFIKDDWCNTPGMVATTAYTTMRNALKAAYQNTDRKIVFSLCEWGLSKPWLWADTIGHMFRTAADNDLTWTKTIQILDATHASIKYSKPGCFADPDILMTGISSSFSDVENQSIFGMWCMLAAPLLAGNNLATMPIKTLDVFTNEDLIAVDQDSLGQGGRKVAIRGGLETWAKAMRDSSTVIALFNRSNDSANMSFNWNEAKWVRYLPGTDSILASKAISTPIYMVRNLLTKDSMKNVTAASISAMVLKHGVAMFRVYPKAPAAVRQGRVAAASPAFARSVSMKRTVRGFSLFIPKSANRYDVRLIDINGKQRCAFSTDGGWNEIGSENAQSMVIATISVNGVCICAKKLGIFR